MSRLREFWERHPDAQSPLQAWYTATEAAARATFTEVRGTFNQASLVGNCVVFNIGGNKYRTATRIMYQTRTVYVVRIMTHGENDDQEKWQSDCGCHKPPKPRPTKKPPKTQGR